MLARRRGRASNQRGPHGFYPTTEALHRSAASLPATLPNDATAISRTSAAVARLVGLVRRRRHRSRSRIYRRVITRARDEGVEIGPMCPTGTGVLESGTLSAILSLEIQCAKNGWRSQQN
jgi:hypothetical protein